MLKIILQGIGQLTPQPQSFPHDHWLSCFVHEFKNPSNFYVIQASDIQLREEIEELLQTVVLVRAEGVKVPSFALCETGVGCYG